MEAKRIIYMRKGSYQIPEEFQDWQVIRQPYCVQVRKNGNVTAYFRQKNKEPYVPNGHIMIDGTLFKVIVLDYSRPKVVA